MGKTAKVGLGIVMLALIAIVIASILIFKNLDGIIKQMIEKVGSDVTQTEVRVSSVEFTLTEGRGEINGITIANPQGFSKANIFSMGKVAVAVDPGSLTGDVIVISEILIDGATLSIEQAGLNTNIKQLLDNIQSKSPATAPEPADTSGSDVRLMLEQFTFSNTKATLTTQQWGEQSLNIPDIQMQNIGDKQTGLTPEQLAGRMVESLVKQTEKAVAKHLKKLAKDAAQDGLKKNLSEKDKARLDSVKSLFNKDK
jgi:uncharacterized protein involved in outer membrane biogenesis